MFLLFFERKAKTSPFLVYFTLFLSFDTTFDFTLPLSAKTLILKPLSAAAHFLLLYSQMYN